MNGSQSQASLDIRGALVVLLFLARCFAFPAELFLRRPGTFGSRYFGFEVLGGLVRIVFWAALWPGHDPSSLKWLLLVVLLLLALVRVMTLHRDRPGPRYHTRYGGEPELARLLRRTPEWKVKALEPVIVLLAGMSLLRWDEPLGSYVMASAAGLFITGAAGLRFQTIRALDMHDALIEQRDAAERLRRMQNGRL